MKTPCKSLKYNLRFLIIILRMCPHLTGLSVYQCHIDSSQLNDLFSNIKKTRKGVLRTSFIHSFGWAVNWHGAFRKFWILRDNLYLNMSFTLKCFSIFISNTWSGERVLCFRDFSLRCWWGLYVTDVGNLRHLTSYFTCAILRTLKKYINIHYRESMSPNKQD